MLESVCCAWLLFLEAFTIAEWNAMLCRRCSKKDTGWKTPREEETTAEEQSAKLHSFNFGGGVQSVGVSPSFIHARMTPNIRVESCRAVWQLQCRF